MQIKSCRQGVSQPMLFAVLTSSARTYLFGLVILAVSISTTCHAAPATGKSFFMPRSISNQAFLTNTHSMQLFREHDEKNSLSIAVTPFYQESTNRKDLARYFFPRNKTDLMVSTGP